VKTVTDRDTLLRKGEMTQNPEAITALLRAWNAGDLEAKDRLASAVYQELHAMARRFLRNEQPGNTLQTTALLNEAYIRFADVKNSTWQHRAQFFALCAQLMRRILVDAARARKAEKRGGGAPKIDLDDVAIVAPQPARLILELDDALKALAELAPRQAQVVELRYFGGMSDEEVAEALHSSPSTVRRDWRFARAWLAHELSGKFE
jgi:RNA polymerase sigma factor (TIGR02999 family)